MAGGDPLPRKRLRLSRSAKNRLVVPGVNDLASRFPDLAAEWDSAANGLLTPRDVTFGAKRKVWWRCEKGHTWRVSVQSRTLDGDRLPGLRRAGDYSG